MEKRVGRELPDDRHAAGTRESAEPLTEMLVRWRGGDQQALADFIPLVYNELRGAARRQLRRERPDHTFQSAALVNELYMRMLVQKPFGTDDRLHFFMLASRLMRQILVDHARSHGAFKRGAEHTCRLDTSIVRAQIKSTDVVAVDDALMALARLDEQQVKIVEMRFFGGLSMEEVAEVLGISLSTAKRDWSVARAWLARELTRGSHDSTGPVGQD